MALGLIVDGLKNFGNNLTSLVATSGVGFTLRSLADVGEVRTLDNSTYAILRGATPLADNDFATKGYVDDGPPTGVVRPLAINVGTTTGSSVTVVQAGRALTQLSVNITTAYSVGATIAVSCGGVVLAAAGAINAQVLGVSVLEILRPATANGPLTVTVAGAPGVGACTAYVEYSTPLQ